MGNDLKHLIFTFDYELFLGSNSGTAEECVLDPTQRVMDILLQYGCNKPLFFVDTLWIYRELQDPALGNRIEKVKKQLKSLAEQGAYIYPHIHPHWLDAKLNPDHTWDLSNISKYRFCNLSDQEKELAWKESMAVLSDFLGLASSDLGYRAGGWSIQPFTDFEPFFRKYNVKYEFSVLPGNAQKTKAQQYDFRNVSFATPYNFSKDIAIPESGGMYTEFPISTLATIRGLKSKLLHKLLWKTGDKYLGNGRSVLAKVLDTETRMGEMASIELLDMASYPYYKNYLMGNNYIQFISHPKMLSKHNLAQLERFLEMATSRFSMNYDFKRLISQ